MQYYKCDHIRGLTRSACERGNVRTPNPAAEHIHVGIELRMDNSYKTEVKPRFECVSGNSETYHEMAHVHNVG